jgi:hypothetical protein
MGVLTPVREGDYSGVGRRGKGDGAVCKIEGMMGKEIWPAKRVAALVLTVGLVALAAYSVAQGTIGAVPLLAIGIALGALYVWRGGSLPEWAYRMRTRGGGRAIRRDDDPSNIPAKVYLPILAGVILLAVLAFVMWRK